MRTVHPVRSKKNLCFIKGARNLYGWYERWWYRGRAYYKRSQIERFDQRRVVRQVNDYHNEELLEKLEALAKEEQDCIGRHPQTFKMMDGSTIGGGSKVRMQYEVECKCITNRYGQQWDNALGKRADNFVQGLI